MQTGNTQQISKVKGQIHLFGNCTSQCYNPVRFLVFFGNKPVRKIICYISLQNKRSTLKCTLFFKWIFGKSKTNFRLDLHTMIPCENLYNYCINSFTVSYLIFDFPRKYRKFSREFLFDKSIFICIPTFRLLLHLLLRNCFTLRKLTL